MAVVERRIRVILEDNAAQFEQHMKGAAGATQEFGTHAGKVEQATGLAGRAMSGMSSLTQQAAASFLGFASAQGVMNLMSMAVNVTKDTVLGFNDAMTQSTAIMGDVSDATKNALGATARQVAVDYNTAVEDVAKGYYYLISAGYDVQSSQLAIGQVTAFAKAGMFDLERATELAADAQNAMGLKSDDAGENLKQLTRITDVLTKANIDANGSVEQFAEALTNKAAGASRLAGISLEETVGVLEAFAAQGVKGKRAGEDYSIVLRDLTTFSRTNADAFRALGITVYDNEGKFAGWSTIIGQVEKALSGMSAEQKNATLATLGLGAESSAYLQVLLGTSGAIAKYTDGVKNAGGATQQVAERQMQSMVEQLKHIRAQAAELGLKAFDGMVQAGQWMAREFGPALRSTGELLRNIGSYAAPVGRAFGALAGAGVVASLSGLARGLEATAGFLAKNEAAAKALALLGFAAIANQALQAAAALAAPAFAAISARLVQAADAALLLQARAATAFDTIAVGAMSASGSLGVAKAALSSLYGILNSPVVGLAIVTAAAYGAVTAFQQGQEEADKFLDTIGKGVNSSSLAALGTELDQINLRMADLGKRTDGIGDMAAAFADIVIPIHDVEGSLVDTAGAEERLNAKAEELRRTHMQASEAMNELAHQLSPLWQGFEKAADHTGVFNQKALDIRKAQAGQEVDKISGALARLAATNNVDLTLPHDQLVKKLRELYQTASQPEAVAQLHGALSTLGDAASTGADRVKALKDALDTLIGVHVSAAQAEDSFAGALDGLNGKLGAGIDLADAYNAKNREAREAVLSAVDAAMKHATSVYEETGSIQQASSVLEGHRARLVDTMVQTGMTREQAEAYIATLHLTPTDIMTLVQADTARAQAAVGGVQGQMNDVRNGANARITADTSQGDAALANFNRQLDAINNRRVMAIVQAAPPQMPLAAGGIIAPYAEGGIRRYAYGSGHEDHVAQIAPGGAMRLWAEPETGGEAYIPLAASKRDRSSSILADVAGMFGYQLIPVGRSYQPGAVSAPVMAAVGGSSVNVTNTVVVNADVNADGQAVAKAAVSAVVPVLRDWTRNLRTEIRTRG